MVLPLCLEMTQRPSMTKSLAQAASVHWKLLSLRQWLYGGTGFFMLGDKVEKP
jgi:hypothetical protein